MANYRIRNDLEQGSKEWLELKKNFITGTLAEDLLTSSKKNALYKARVKQERSLKYRGFVSKAAKIGVEREPVARDLLSKFTNRVFIETGFIESLDFENCGVSLDGCIFTDDDHQKEEIEAICEIKSYQIKHHLEVIKRGEPDPRVMSQIQWGLFITGANMCYYVGYCPDMLDPTMTPDGQKHIDQVLWIKKIEPDDKYFNAFRAKLDA